jgi:CRP-like cAMP-binding protein
MLNPTLKPALLVCALLVAGAGHAADKPKEATFGKGKASGPVLTREQLRQCLAQQAQVKDQEAELVRLQAGLNTDKALIVRSGEVLSEQGAALDRTKPELVSAYNEQVLARDKAIDELQARGAQFNERAGAANLQREAFAKACEGRTYNESDEIAIQKGK